MPSRVCVSKAWKLHVKTSILFASVLLLLESTNLTGGKAAAVLPASIRSPLLRLEWEHDRLLASVDSSLFGVDFLLSAEVIGLAGKNHTHKALPEIGTRTLSGALRLQDQGDSIILSEYVSTMNGRLQYRRRAAMPISRRLQGRTVIINAAAMRDMLEPEFGSAAVKYEVEAVPLPKIPMRPRLHDPRVTFFRKRLRAAEDGSFPEGAYITRHRLEKKVPTASVSEVVQPIIVRIDASVPRPWVSRFKQAAEDWNSAFEAIGFRRAIKAVAHDEAPAATPARELTLRWQEGTSQRAIGSNITDPRSGEILSAKITFSSALVDGLQRMYFARAGLRDSRARFPFPDSLTSALLQFTVRHEIGHALGLDHNFQGNAYPTDSLRRPDFVRRMGSGPSTMGYAWVNYVAQPEDRIPLESIVPGIGPYDRWIVRWGYRPIPEAETPEQERPILEQWRAAQDTAVYLRSSHAHLGAHDPYTSPHVLGDDLLKSVGYGIRNIAGLAKAADAELTDKSREILKSEWDDLLSLVPAAIGGSIPQNPYPRDVTTIPLQPIDSIYQVQALRFVLNRLFYGQDELVAVILPQSPRGHSTLVLFDSLAPAWEAGHQSWRWPMHRVQQERLSGLIKRLPQVVQQNQPGVLTALCREFATLEQRLSALPMDNRTPETRQHVEALTAILASAFAPSKDQCTR